MNGSTQIGSLQHLPFEQATNSLSYGSWTGLGAVVGVRVELELVPTRVALDLVPLVALELLARPSSISASVPCFDLSSRSR